jgi:hypothetical protein
VLAAFAEVDEPAHVVSLAVRALPGSGSADELLATAGIDAESIAKAARRLVTAPNSVRVSP